MYTRQKDKEKEKEKDVAPGERTPKVSGVGREPSALVGGWFDRAYGRFGDRIHPSFPLFYSSLFSSYYVIL